MKVLIIQLARLGDILQTWPALAAFKEKHPQSEIHVLCREKFSAAYYSCPHVDQVHILPTKAVLSPLIATECDVKSSYDSLSVFLEDLKSHNFETIFNLSFSPVSSYIAHQIEGVSTAIGYTRFSDGFLSIPDDMSAYFYAQVGPGRHNRYHLAEVFGTLLGVDLSYRHWGYPLKKENIKRHQVLMHVGASEAHKTMSVEKTTAIINHLLKVGLADIALIGSENESQKAETALAGVPGTTVHNYVGKTNFEELVHLIAGASVVIGPDSAPMHIAALTGTPCLNISLGNTNFWETGPRSLGSCVLRGTEENEIASDKIASVALKIVEGGKQDLGVIQTKLGTPSYEVFTPKDKDFAWRFCQAIYTGSEFPDPIDEIFLDGVVRLQEVNQLIMEQLISIENGVEVEKVAPIIDRGEEIISTISGIVPSLGILVRWYQTEKLRIGPGEIGIILKRTMDIHKLLGQVLEIYNPTSRPEDEKNEASR